MQAATTSTLGSRDPTVLWLKAAAAIVVAFGSVIALAAHPLGATPAGLLADLVFWPLDGRQQITSPEARLLCAISGGLMVGWGVMLWLVASRLYPRDPALARLLFVASVLAWLVVDSLGSVVAGAPLNALLNVGFVALLLLPFAARSQPDIEPDSRR